MTVTQRDCNARLPSFNEFGLGDFEYQPAPFGVLYPKLLLRTLPVLFDSPGRDLPSRIEQVLKPTYVQTLFPQPAIENFLPGVLRRLAGRMSTRSICRSTHRVRKCRLVSSGPCALTYWDWNVLENILILT